MNQLRENYFNLVLIGKSNRCFLNVFKSLKYATHCKLCVVSNELQIDDADGAHIEWININDIGSIEDQLKITDLIFVVTSGYYKVTQANSICLNELLNLFEDDKSKASDFRLGNEFCDDFIREMNSYRNTPNFSSDAADFYMNIGSRILHGNKQRIKIDFLHDFAGKFVYLGAVKILMDFPSVTYFPIDKDSLSDIAEDISCILTESEVTEGVVSIELEIDSSKGLLEIINLDRSCDHWIALRVIGINIPLILVQNFLGRSVRTLGFIDIKDVRLRPSTGKFEYGFEYNSVFVDLDETIVLGGRPVLQTISFIDRCVKLGKIVSIVSRHKQNIRDTLKSIGVNDAIFKNIIRIEQVEKKSSYIARDAIFIDNEFPERLDVRQTLNIPVLDVNQLEFAN